MEVRIRLQRAGKVSKSRYNYRIVAMSRNKGRDSRNLEIIGHYDAARNPAVIGVNYEKLQKWLDNGASMSDTVRTLVKKSKKASSQSA
ncbi:MAG: 30S ribosomal protein S16 [Candidatus Omnitrophica bacterium]|nr:30S ribosomal protein S16 [Candidatus Omnitrophota bacterium]MCB9721783.1 30S ribosomal protein S16 [Candidatus Omnitrophota bacterium]